MLVYIPVTHCADRMGKWPFALATFAFFTAFPPALLQARSFPGLVLAFILRGCKEFGKPARKALILDLDPDGHKAAVFGLYYLIHDIFVASATFGSSVLWTIAPIVIWSLLLFSVVLRLSCFCSATEEAGTSNICLDRSARRMRACEQWKALHPVHPRQRAGRFSPYARSGRASVCIPLHRSSVSW
ncbi:MAG: major facilitator superfamily protein [Rhodospirillaceae bacterium]|nr:MAG: major facilitator superfamily protein [Rhodospirillaceae bacterium]